MPVKNSEGPKPHSDRKSTRLNSSHSQISYAVFCLQKKERPIDTREQCVPGPPRAGSLQLQPRPTTPRRSGDALNRCVRASGAWFLFFFFLNCPPPPGLPPLPQNRRPTF